MKPVISFFDTTLRDGAQTQGVDFSLADKHAIITALDDFGIDYIEVGWPGANPVDSAIGKDPPHVKHSKLVAFGMTRRSGISAGNDPGVAALVKGKIATLCLVGKTSIYHVQEIINTTATENLAMIADSFVYGVSNGKQMMFDAEHFFDGFRLDREYAIACLEHAHNAGAKFLVLCDTNGGTMPNEIHAIVTEVREKLPTAKLGIHCHNDTGQAVANSQAAVAAGATQIQATINGIGERCGNTNLITMISNLCLKTTYPTGIAKAKLTGLTKLSQLLDERLGTQPNPQLPYVGRQAFAHKGGLHGAAVVKQPSSYEHISPDVVGNNRVILMSDQGGRANLLARLKHYGIDEQQLSRTTVASLLNRVKQQEFQGMSYEGADASLELLINQELGFFSPPFSIDRFRVIDEIRINSTGKKHFTESEATIILDVAGEKVHMVAFGNGPVNALDVALRQALLKIYPYLSTTHLNDYKVRIIPPPLDSIGTDASTRVTIEFRDNIAGQEVFWSCSGLSANIIDASMLALLDAYHYRLYKYGDTNKSERKLG